MLFVHQEGAVKVGEVVRYTLTYTPALDQRPCSALYLRIKNTSGIPYRAAYLVGPYTIHVSAYPSTFNPYKKLEDPQRDGVPQFEPNLKAGGHWHATLSIPEDIRQQAPNDRSLGEPLPSYTWIIEIASQILFSNVASVHFELLVARDERSLDTGFAALASRGHAEPGRTRDLISYSDDGPGPHPSPKGVYSKAVKLIAEDTAQLWNKPALPHVEQHKSEPTARPQLKAEGPDDLKERPANEKPEMPKKRKKIHLVVLTHGLHSNVGADMLYMKESIDATAKQALQERQKRRAAEKNQSPAKSDKPEKKADEDQETSTAPLSGGQEDLPQEEEEDPDDEQVVVRGFSGNVVRTEKGIQYLGKRLAKYILTVTFPDQPFLPQAKSMTRSFSLSFPSSRKGSLVNESSAHKFNPEEIRPFQFTSISFVGHSLGGLIQLYAVGYIQKHSPDFFNRIKPVNFITMAAPLLGLSNENPMYVKFALDFGLVGRTGQDLGLTWRAPTLARSGWNAMFSGFGATDKEEKPKQEDPRSKPLLRILPSGPAHHVLRMFRNRTVYSNIVNDGIVPLRTSCLLFLDWRGLERVDNARRENGLLGTLAQFGWAELTGANTISHKPESRSGISFDSTNVEGDKDDDQAPSSPHDQRQEPSEGALKSPMSPGAEQLLGPRPDSPRSTQSSSDPTSARNSLERPQTPASPFDRFLDFIRPKPAADPKPRKQSRSARKPYERAQTLKKDPETEGHKSEEQVLDEIEDKKKRRPLVTRGSSLMSNDSSATNAAPPKTSIFEAAGDIINPPIPTISWLTDPSSRSRTIFHDRVYYPEDIPPPPSKKRAAKLTKASNESLKDSQPPSTPTTPKSPLVSPTQRSRTERELGSEVDSSGMKVEEKIARAYHRELSWRKVLVRLEPDAHNNMIVRRMFANAYGWDVVRHLCDTHFADTYAARTGDEDEDGRDRAKPAGQDVGENGDLVSGQRSKEQPSPAGDGAQDETARKQAARGRTVSELREVDDKVPELGAASGAPAKRTGRRDSIPWSDDFFEGTDDDDWDSHDEQ